jgi:hypothetical protein
MKAAIKVLEECIERTNKILNDTTVEDCKRWFAAEGTHLLFIEERCKTRTLMTNNVVDFYYSIDSETKKKKKKAPKMEQQIHSLVEELQRFIIAFQLTTLFKQQQRSLSSTSSTEHVVLWVDDNPENNGAELTTATDDYKLTVIQKTSTKQAQEFVNSKKQQLTNNQYFGVVTDCYR